MNNKKARVIAFYLPQFHPIPENDEWWGKGFTEWTNVGKAKPLFRGHYQPKVPADLGYYDLRVPEVREAQAQMARDAGIEGFCYWHYWFGNGKRLLERPFNEVLESGKPDFPFCLGWANHSWADKTWISKGQYQKTKILLKQRYLGEEDYTKHFLYILKAFNDSRYIKIEGKPVFYIYDPLNFEDVCNFISLWQKLSRKHCLPGIYFIGQAQRAIDCEKIRNLGFDGICHIGMQDAEDNIKGGFINKILKKIIRRYLPIYPLQKYNYAKIIKYLLVKLDENEDVFPTIVPNFDHSPRSGKRGLIYTNSSPELFRKLLRKAIKIVKNKDSERKIIFLRSWNEWGEGNYVEPDLKYGYGYLTVLKKELLDA